MIRLNPFGLKQLGHVEGQPDPLDDFWYQPVGSRTGSGVAVTQQSALTYSACWSATRILADGVAALPAILFRKTGDREKKPAENHSLFDVLHRRANPGQDSFCFFEQMQAWLVNRGNAYAEIERAPFTDRVTALWPVHPSRIVPTDSIIDPDGSITYSIRNDDGTTTPITNRVGEPHNLLHVTGALPEDGPFGRGVIQQARESIGFGLATERHGASFFGNGARPGGVLKHSGTLSEEARKNLRREWNEVHQGPSQTSKIALLQDGVDYEAIGVSNEDSQFLQTREFNVTEIARWYNLPPHRLGDLSRATFSNIEQQSIDFVIHSLRPWLVRWEKAIENQLLTAAERRQMFFKFKIHGLLRGDSAARAAYYNSLFHMGVLSQNDIRELEDMNPIEDGDHYFVPMNIEPIEQRIEDDPEPVAPVVPEPPKEGESEEDEDNLDKKLDGLAATLGNSFGDLYERLLEDQQLRHEGKLEHAEGQFRIRMTSELERSSELGSKLSDAEERHEREREQIDSLTLQAQRHEEESASKLDKIHRAIQRSLAADVQRMLTKEANAAQRAAKKPDEFLRWLDTFYDSHTDTLAAVIAPSIEALRVVDDSADVGLFVARHIDRSKEDLLSASECSPADLPESVAKCVAGWESRSKVD